MPDQEDGRPPATEATEAPIDPPAAGERLTGDQAEGAGNRPPHDPDPHPELGTVEERPGASAGQRVADAVPHGDMGRSMATRGRGLQDEEAPPFVDGVFICLAHPTTGDVEKACGCSTFTRGAIVGLTQGGDEANVVYTCRGCGAKWQFQGAPVPSWQWVQP